MALHFWPTVTPAIQLVLFVISILMIGVSWNNYIEKMKHAKNFPSVSSSEKKRSALMLAIIVSGSGVLLLALTITWILIVRKNKS